jgi:nucleoside-diphosphate-sugar epimerase
MSLDFKISKPTKILLTGARGFTGKHLISEALSRKIDVIGLQSDITKAADLEKEVLQISPDAVIHCAGISFVASKDQEAFYRVHALGTSNLLAALTKLPKRPSKVLLASSATVYGNAALTPTPEDYALKPIDHYAMSKVAMEEMAKTFFEQLPIIIARPFNYTGPGQHDNFLIPKLIRHFSRKIPHIELGNLNVEREFNDVSSICQAYLALLEHGDPGEIYNVGTGKVRSLKSVVDTLIQLTSHPIQITVNPDFVRTNEVHRMCGDPTKLQDLLIRHQIELQIPAIEKTLQSMLDAASSN